MTPVHGLGTVPHAQGTGGVVADRKGATSRTRSIFPSRWVREGANPQALYMGKRLSQPRGNLYYSPAGKMTC
jgi:hypothetical protein